MKTALILCAQCQNCTDCAVQLNCKYNAILREEPDDKPWIDGYKCCGCMKCKLYCPHGAVEQQTTPCNLGSFQV